MNKLKWKKIESRGFKYYLLVYGTRIGIGGAVFAALFKSVGFFLIYDRALQLDMFLSDLYSPGLWIFMTGYIGAYLNWKGYTKKYN